MRNFLRVMQLTLRRRLTFALTVTCALFVALFWGSNLGLVKPIVDITFSGKSPHKWADDEVLEAAQRVHDLEKKIADEQLQLPLATAAERADIRKQLDADQLQLVSERLGLKQAEAYHPWIVRYLPDSSFWALALLMGILCTVTVVKDGFLAGHMILVERLAQLSAFDLRAKLMRKTLGRELEAFGNDRSSDLLSRFTTDVSSVTAAVNAMFGRVLLEPLKMLACLIGAALICWRLLIVSLIVAPLAGYVAYKLAQSLKRANRRAMEQMSQLYNRITESLTGIQAVKAFGMERYESRRFHEASKDYFFKAIRIAVYNAGARTSAELMGTIIISLAILCGAYLVLNQQTTLLGIKIMERPLSSGSLLAFYALLAGISDPARKLADVFNYIQRGLAAADRVYEVLDAKSKIVDPPKAERLANPQPEVVFDNVSFHYKAGNPVLKNISFRIPYGKTVAVVGPNGCGKSTLISLLLRFYDPVEGSIRLDHLDLRQMRQQDLRSRIGLVAQQAMLFDDTVIANIRYGSPQATDAEVIEAATKAHAHRFITEKLEKGYQTVVGERGGKLSGGQRQRILLARAILRDPAILILDEATSQIDLESEQLIHRVLEQFTRGRTTLMITHRVASLALADEVLVLDGGRVLDIGTHEELIGRCELYRRLYHLGFKATA
ncbi:ABC transporter ATP-binding protein [Anatilimnocola floriformis]|uniref:ABC transporter ATP-binding protein n=1 Tax=Anatilimnocola floriformis TaxID=2948575 RepID=UPI0020C37654|nr:ABC transporter ATP-binding protein [Anatilimnocola floriformis]